MIVWVTLKYGPFSIREIINRKKKQGILVFFFCIYKHMKLVQSLKHKKYIYLSQTSFYSFNQQTDNFSK